MKRILLVRRFFNLILLAAIVSFCSGPAWGQFRRGDANDDAHVSMFDFCAISDFLFAGGALTCEDAADVDDDGFVAAADLVFLVTYLCIPLSPAPPLPGPVFCGPDPTLDALVPCVYTSCAVVPCTLAPNSRFIRGDCNGDLSVSIADAITMLTVLFGGGTSCCCDACDANDDGQKDIADAIFLLSYLFVFGLPPPAPFPGCGCDPTDCLPDRLDCAGGTCP